MNRFSTSVFIKNLSNELDPECGGGKKELKKLIEEKFGTAKDFQDTAFGSQFSIQNIIFTKPSPRHQMIIDFLGLDIFNKFARTIKDKHSELEYKIKRFTTRDLQDDFKKSNDVINEETNELEILSIKEKDYEDNPELLPYQSMLTIFKDRKHGVVDFEIPLYFEYASRRFTETEEERKYNYSWVKNNAK